MTVPSCHARLYSRMHQRSMTRVCYQHKYESSTLHRLNHACQAHMPILDNATVTVTAVNST